MYNKLNTSLNIVVATETLYIDLKSKVCFLYILSLNIFHSF